MHRHGGINQQSFVEKASSKILVGVEVHLGNSKLRAVHIHVGQFLKFSDRPPSPTLVGNCQTPLCQSSSAISIKPTPLW